VVPLPESITLPVQPPMESGLRGGLREREGEIERGGQRRMPVFMSYGMLYVALPILHSADNPYGALVIVAVHTLSEVWMLIVCVFMSYGMMCVALPILF